MSDQLEEKMVCADCGMPTDKFGAHDRNVEGFDRIEAEARPCWDNARPVRSALAPRVGENISIPALDITDIDRTMTEATLRIEEWDANVAPVARQFYDMLYCRERQLRASQDEVERLRGERDKFRMALSVSCELHGCSSPHCTPAEYLRDAGEMMQKLSSAESALTTCREDERKRCLEAVRGERLDRHDKLLAADEFEREQRRIAPTAEQIEQSVRRHEAQRDYYQKRLEEHEIALAKLAVQAPHIIAPVAKIVQ